MTELRISPDLALPIEFATEGVLVTGMRGSGKTNTAVRFVEVEYDAGIPFALVDPKGDTHGIRSSSDGKAPGLSVPVFGGLHGDFPLEAATGARIADLLVDEMLSAVLDVSMLSKTGELPRFLTAFCNQLMHRHQLEPHVRTVVLAEAHRYIPQSGQQLKGDRAVLKEAAASLLLEGRAFGLGCWAETQRPARLNKDVVEEVGTAILHRIGVAATNDKKTIAGWVSHHELAGEIVDSLTSLRAGEAWVLAPDLDILKRVRMDRRTTFDSAATPKAGAAPRRPSTMADIDAGAIKAALEDVIEKAKADDPAELKKQVASLKREVAEARSATPEPIVERIEVPVLDEETRDAIRMWTAAVAELPAMFVEKLDGLSAVGHRVLEQLEAHLGRQDVPRAGAAGRGAGAVADRRGAGRAAQRPDPPARREPRRAPVPRAEAGTDTDLSAYAAHLLDALAKRHPVPLTERQWSVASDRSTTSSGWAPSVRELERGGYVVRDSGDWVATDLGLEVAGVDPGTPPPTGSELVDWWCRRIPGPAQTALRTLVDIELGAGVTVDDVADAAGWSRTSSGPGAAVTVLVKLGLAERSGGLVFLDGDLR